MRSYSQPTTKTVVGTGKAERGSITSILLVCGILAPLLYVAMNIVFYYEQGNPRGRRDPDVLVARGVVGKHLRRSFRVWEEGVWPCTLFEISSEKTWRRDIGPKRRLYARLNIPEYFVFDPSVPQSNHG